MYEDSREPVTLHNITQKILPSTTLSILNKRFRIEIENNNDISYEYSGTLSMSVEEPVVTIEESKTLEESQLTSVIGNLTLDSDSIEQVMWLSYRSANPLYHY